MKLLYVIIICMSKLKLSKFSYQEQLKLYLELNDILIS